MAFDQYPAPAPTPEPKKKMSLKKKLIIGGAGAFVAIGAASAIANPPAPTPGAADKPVVETTEAPAPETAAPEPPKETTPAPEPTTEAPAPEPSDPPVVVDPAPPAPEVNEEELYLEMVRAMSPELYGASDADLLDLAYGSCDVLRNGGTFEDLGYLVVSQPEPAQPALINAIGVGVGVLCPEENQ